MIERDVSVWDFFVRIFHWTVVAACSIAYLTEDELLAAHVWAGYVVGGMVVLRIVWGVLGPRHARFSDFVYGPGATLGYLGDLVRSRPRRYIGHSPAGGAMVVILVAGLLAVVGTGLVTYAIRNHAGPLVGLVTADAGLTTSPRIISPGFAAAKDDDHERLREPPSRSRPARFWKAIHGLLANIVLILAGIHVLGVVVMSFMHRENLVRAMITGRKRVGSE
jgi:cytochrome b